MCKQHALRIAWTIARSIAFLDFRVLRWKFTYDWKCVNTTYRVPLFCPLPASRKGLRLTLRSALFGEGGRDWRPCFWVAVLHRFYCITLGCFFYSPTIQVSYMSFVRVCLVPCKFLEPATSSCSWTDHSFLLTNIVLSLYYSPSIS